MATKKKTRAQEPQAEALQVRGFFRVNIVEQDGRISGDSGWVPNRVVNLGLRDYLCTPLIGGAAKSISRMALGTGGVPATTDTALAGELSHQTNAASGTRNRIACTTSQLGSATVELQGVFQSAISFCTASVVISNIMVINDTTSGGTIFAGNTYTASTLNTNQDVQASYRITFATTT